MLVQKVVPGHLALAIEGILRSGRPRLQGSLLPLLFVHEFGVKRRVVDLRVLGVGVVRGVAFRVEQHRSETVSGAGRVRGLAVALLNLFLSL